MGLYFKNALHIMMNDDGFRSGAVIRWYLLGIGAFGKKKGAHDLKAMKSTLKFLKNKEPVLALREIAAGKVRFDKEVREVLNTPLRELRSEFDHVESV